MKKLLLITTALAAISTAVVANETVGTNTTSTQILGENIWVGNADASTDNINLDADNVAITGDTTIVGNTQVTGTLIIVDGANVSEVATQKDVTNLQTQIDNIPSGGITNATTVIVSDTEGNKLAGQIVIDNTQGLLVADDGWLNIGGYPDGFSVNLATDDELEAATDAQAIVDSGQDLMITGVVGTVAKNTTATNDLYNIIDDLDDFDIYLDDRIDELRAGDIAYNGPAYGNGETTVAGAINNVTGHVDIAKNSAANAQATANDALSEALDNGDDIGTLQGQVSALEAGTYDDTELQAAIDANTAGIDSIDGQIKFVAGSLSEQFIDLDGEVKDNAALNVSQNGWIDDNANDITAIEGDVENINIDIDNLQAVDAFQGDRILENTHATLDNATDIDTIEFRNGLADELITDNYHATVNNGNAIADLEESKADNVITFEGREATLEEAIKDNNGEVDTLKDTVERHQDSSIRRDDNIQADVDANEAAQAIINAEQLAYDDVQDTHIIANQGNITDLKTNKASKAELLAEAQRVIDEAQAALNKAVAAEEKARVEANEAQNVIISENTSAIQSNSAAIANNSVRIGLESAKSAATVNALIATPGNGVGVGIGSHDGNAAVSVGVKKQLSTSTFISGSVSVASGTKPTFGIGFGWTF